MSEQQITAFLTYASTTPESAEDGCHSDHGVYMPGGWTYSCVEPSGPSRLHELGDYVKLRKDMKDNPELYEITGTVEEILFEADQLGIYSARKGPVEDWRCLSWSSEPEVVDWTTGEDRSYTLHLKGAEGLSLAILNEINTGLLS